MLDASRAPLHTNTISSRQVTETRIMARKRISSPRQVRFVIEPSRSPWAKVPPSHLWRARRVPLCLKSSPKSPPRYRRVVKSASEVRIDPTPESLATRTTRIHSPIALDAAKLASFKKSSVVTMRLAPTTPQESSRSDDNIGLKDTLLPQKTRDPRDLTYLASLHASNRALHEWVEVIDEKQWQSPRSVLRGSASLETSYGRQICVAGKRH